jgi:anti-sigma28 factor (negative regulator of flagellin synthesis)
MSKLNISLVANHRDSSGKDFTLKPAKKTSGNTKNESKLDQVSLSEPSTKKSSKNRKSIISDLRYDLVKKYREILADGSYQVKSDELADKIVQKVKENKNSIFL